MQEENEDKGRCGGWHGVSPAKYIRVWKGIRGEGKLDAEEFKNPLSVAHLPLGVTIPSVVCFIGLRVRFKAL
ncbi:MAG: hypothetical protein H5T72_09015 [Actinobacteria bacterium]|nr:hypothetical protein [Actinomycetota bacterium]